jgi:hypothetical protein
MVERYQANVIPDTPGAQQVELLESRPDEPQGWVGTVVCPADGPDALKELVRLANLGVVLEAHCESINRYFVSKGLPANPTPYDVSVKNDWGPFPGDAPPPPLNPAAPAGYDPVTLNALSDRGDVLPPPPPAVPPGHRPGDRAACGHCKGKGFHPDMCDLGGGPCGVCHGTGGVEVPLAGRPAGVPGAWLGTPVVHEEARLEDGGAPPAGEVLCSACDGTGGPGRTCGLCLGRGVLTETPLPPAPEPTWRDKPPLL